MTAAFLDTNVLIRHLTGDPAELGSRATAYLAAADQLLLADLVVAETVYVLGSYHETPREQVAQGIRSVLAFPSVAVLDPALLLRAVGVYEHDRLDFAEAYLVACTELTGVGVIASFDSSVDRVTTVRRVEP